MIAVVRYNLKTYGRHFTLLHNHGMSSHQNYLNVLRGYYYFSEKFLIQGGRLGLWLAEICTGIIYQELLHTKSPDLTEMFLLNVNKKYCSSMGMLLYKSKLTAFNSWDIINFLPQMFCLGNFRSVQSHCKSKLALIWPLIVYCMWNHFSIN